MGLSIIVAASRQTWAFSRDGALPFSSFFRPISQRFGYIPLRAIWGCALLAAVLGLLSLIAPAAAQALFSLGVAGNNLAWGVPIFARVWWGQRKFKPGPFYTGERFSVPIAWAAVTFLSFGIILCMFPVGGPGPTRESSLFSCPRFRFSLSSRLAPSLVAFVLLVRWAELIVWMPQRCFWCRLLWLSIMFVIRAELTCLMPLQPKI